MNPGQSMAARKACAPGFILCLEMNWPQPMQLIPQVFPRPDKPSKTPKTGGVRYAPLSRKQ